MIIGVTGPSGAGKTIISNMLVEMLQCEYVNADKVAREQAKEGTEYFTAIIRAFGDKILDEKNEINRKLLAEIIYEGKTERETLNDLTTFYVAEEIKKEAFLKLERAKIVIIDVPRLMESGLNKICDITISVLADYDVRLNRICERDDIDEETAKKRLQIQETDEFYIENSDYVVTTNEDNAPEQLEAIVSNIKKEIQNESI